MKNLMRVGLAAGALSLGLTLAGCENFDPTALFDSEIFNTKKKLPGERHPVFPEGTPGVSQGVPPEMVKGYQPPPEPEATPKQTPKQATAEPAEAHKPKHKPKPKVAAKPADTPATTGTVQPAQPASQQAQWPEQPQAQRPAPTASAAWPGTAQSSGGVAWPEPPAQR